MDKEKVKQYKQNLYKRFDKIQFKSWDGQWDFIQDLAFLERMKGDLKDEDFLSACNEVTAELKEKSKNMSFENLNLVGVDLTEANLEKETYMKFVKEEK